MNGAVAFVASTLLSRAGNPKLAPKPLGGCISASAAPRADIEPGRLKLHAKLSQLMVLGLHQIAVTLWLLKAKQPWGDGWVSEWVFVASALG